MQLSSGCMWIWFADSIPTLVGFLWALQFPPAPKNQNPFIFLVHSFWSLVACISLFVCLRFNYLCVGCGCHTAAFWEPSGLIWRALQKLQIIIIIITPSVYVFESLELELDLGYFSLSCFPECRLCIFPVHCILLLDAWLKQFWWKFEYLA